MKHIFSANNTLIWISPINIQQQCFEFYRLHNISTTIYSWEENSNDFTRLFFYRHHKLINVKNVYLLRLSSVNVICFFQRSQKQVHMMLEIYNIRNLSPINVLKIFSVRIWNKMFFFHPVWNYNNEENILYRVESTAAPKVGSAMLKLFNSV